MALKNVEMILDELKVDYLDLCLIHWPFGYAEETGDLFPKNQDGIAQMSDVDYLDTWRFTMLISISIACSSILNTL